MKAILKYPLYRRIQPGNLTAASEYLDEGSLITIEKVVPGTELDGISLWYHSSDGFYYWGGGINAIEGTDNLEWYEFPYNTQLAILASVVRDEAYHLEKKAIRSLGYGMGFKNDDAASGLAVIIFVTDKTPDENLPETISYKGIQGIPVDIKAIKEAEHHEYRDNGIKDLKPDNSFPLELGGSISVSDSGKYGTRSLVLSDADDNTYLMTCFHVLLGRFKHHQQYPFPESPEVESDYPCKTRNRSGIQIRKEKVVAGRYSSNYDFSLISLSEATDLVNSFDNRRFNGFYTEEEMPSLMGKEVMMAGATSVMQKGLVQEVFSSLTLGSNPFSFENIIVTEKISMPGDSGAPVIDNSNKIVGIVIGGNKEEKTYVLPIYNIIFQLGYSLANKT